MGPLILWNLFLYSKTILLYSESSSCLRYAILVLADVSENTFYITSSPTKTHALSLTLNKQYLLRFSGKIQILHVLNIHPSQEFQCCGGELWEWSWAAAGGRAEVRGAHEAQAGVRQNVHGETVVAAHDCFVCSCLRLFLPPFFAFWWCTHR